MGTDFYEYQVIAKFWTKSDNYDLPLQEFIIYPERRGREKQYPIGPNHDGKPCQAILNLLVVNIHFCYSILRLNARWQKSTQCIICLFQVAFLTAAELQTLKSWVKVSFKPNNWKDVNAAANYPEHSMCLNSVQEKPITTR